MNTFYYFKAHRQVLIDPKYSIKPNFFKLDQLMNFKSKQKLQNLARFYGEILNYYRDILNCRHYLCYLFSLLPELAMTADRKKSERKITFKASVNFSSRRNINGNYHNLSFEFQS